MRYTFKKSRPTVPVQKDAVKSMMLQRLRTFLDRAEPQLVYFLVNTWLFQGKAITYKELREAILRGDIDQALLQRWHEDYSLFVVNYLQPAWEEAMRAATADMEARYKDWRFDPMAAGVRQWTENRAAEFVTNVTNTQIEALRAVVSKAADLEDMNVDQLARAIRPMVGLYKGQITANLNYYTNLINSGVSEKKALDLSVRYSARQHRYRGYLIARTELAFAYNQGSYEGTKQAQEQGYMGDVIKIWCTAHDERVCLICDALEDEKVFMDDEFYYDIEDRDGNVIRRRINPKLTHAPETGRVPPAHPGCRCVVMYEEISPPRRRSEPFESV